MNQGSMLNRLTALLHPGYREVDPRNLRSRAWLDHALLTCGLPLDEFAYTYVYRGRSRSNLVRKWFAGEAIATNYSVEQVEKHLPGSAWAYNHPLFTLIEDRALSKRQILKLLSPYLDSARGNIWAFPRDKLLAHEYGRSSVSTYDTYSLVKRHDLWGFMAIVGLVRLAELSNNDLLHCECCCDMYRALPAALAVPWLSGHADLLTTCIQRIRRRVVVSQIMFDVDWDLLDRQTANLVASLRLCRPSGAVPHVYEDPILPAYIVRGKQWRQLDDATRNIVERGVATVPT